MLGKAGCYAETCRNEGFIGVDFLNEDLVKNRKYTELGKQYDIYEEDGALVGQQYPTVCPNIDFYRYQIDFKLIKD